MYRIKMAIVVSNNSKIMVGMRGKKKKTIAAE